MSAEWVNWRGGDCPVTSQTRIEVKTRDGETVEDDDPEGWRWSHMGTAGDIVAYRVVDEFEGDVGVPEEYEQRPHNHYHKDVSHLQRIDVYRIIDLYKVTDPCFQHAIKKLLVTGERGHKSIEEDVQNIIDTLERWKEMRKEDNGSN